MNRFLLKTEPSEYSFDDLVREKRTSWSGVSNPTALIHLRSMKKNDAVLIYHSGKEKQIVGIAQCAGDAYPDPDRRDTKFVAIDIVPLNKLSKPVTLAAIKSDKAFKNFPLVTISRLSVMPVSKVEWDSIIMMSE